MTKLHIEYGVVGNAVPPRQIRLDVGGWGGPASEKMVDGSNPQPWHCLPFIEGSTYGLELVYPHETECRIVNDGTVRIDWDFAAEPGGSLTGFEFVLFAPLKASKYYLFNTRVDIQPPPGYVLRTEPHPRYFTQDDGTCPLAMIGHLQNEWYPRLTFVVFRAPRPGETHVFRKGEPIAQILFVPRQITYDLTPMPAEHFDARRKLEKGIFDARAEIAENAWRNPDNAEFNNHYKLLVRAFLKNGLAGVESTVAGAAARIEAAFPVAQSAAEFVELGKKRIEAGEFEEAFRLLVKAHELQPNNAEALANLGICFACYPFFPGMDKGLELMRAASALDPTNAGYHRNLAELLRRMNRLADAEECIRRAVQLRGDDASHRFVLATILLSQGRIAEGFEAYRAAALLGVPPDRHLALGSTLAQLGRPVEARSCFQAALTIDPGYGVAREALATLGPIGPLGPV